MSSPWFLKEISYLDDAGFPLWLRRRAAKQLEAVFPAKECRRMLLSDRGAIIRDLFAQVGVRIGLLLELGAALDVVGPLQDKNLIGDLRTTTDFIGAMSEITVWANLLRARFDVDRVPKVPKQRSHDFKIFADHRMIVRVRRAPWPRVIAGALLNGDGDTRDLDGPRT